MNALRASFASAVLLGFALAGPPAAAQAVNFDDKPTGFLTARTGGMPADAWNGTSLGTAKNLVSALPVAPRSRALRDLQFKVLVSELTPPRPDGSPPPSLFARKVEKLAAMGEGENLNEMVRNAGGYADPAIATTVTNAMMMAGEREGACNIARNWQLTEPFARRAEAACRFLAGEATGTPGALPGPVDGPAVMMLDLARLQPPASLLSSTQPPIIRALVGFKTLPIATRIDIAERGEALAIIEATRLGDLYAEAVRDGVALPPAMARRARLVAAARSASNAEEIVNSIIAVYGEARGSPMFPTIARASAAGLLNLPAKTQFARVAQEAMRGFLLLGDKQQTQAWTRLALGAAYNNVGALNALDRVLPLAAVAGIDDPKRLPPAEVNRWFEVIRQDDPARAPLLGSIAAGETPLAELHPAAVAAIVQALRQVGEDHAARLFAIETAIAYGL